MKHPCFKMWCRVNVWTTIDYYCINTRKSLGSHVHILLPSSPSAAVYNYSTNSEPLQYFWGGCGRLGKGKVRGVILYQWIAGSDPYSAHLTRVLWQDTSPTMPSDAGQRVWWLSVSVSQSSCNYTGFFSSHGCSRHRPWPTLITVYKGCRLLMSAAWMTVKCDCLVHGRCMFAWPHSASLLRWYVYNIAFVL